MKKLNKLCAILFAVLGVSATAKADTTILSESEGWTKITSLPSDLGAYYYVFVDNGQDLMMTLGDGANQGYKTMWYQASGNPLEDLNKVWTLEANSYTTNGVSFRNVTYNHLAFQTEYNAAWYFHTHDNGGTQTGFNVEWTAFSLVYASGAWTVQNGKYPDSGYLGPWENVIQTGAEVACNKSGDAIGYFQIYAIEKQKFNELYIAARTKAGEVNIDLSFNIGNPTIGGVNVFWTDGVDGGNFQYSTNKTSASGGGMLESWKWEGSVGKVYQTVSYLPDGDYDVKMLAFRDEAVNGGETVYVYANDDKTLVSTANLTEHTVETTITGNQVELGLIQESEGYRWMGLDEVSLIYKVTDASAFQEALAALIEKANPIKDSKMGAAESAALNKALDEADAESNDIDKLETMSNALQSAYEAAVASIELYATVLPYITKAEGIDASITTATAYTEYRTQYDAGTITDDAVAVFQNLEVATYNYVTKNFTYPVELEANGWIPEGPVGTMTSQHYDGTSTSSYLEQSSAAWASSAWEISYKYEKTLPAGKYIFKVAGRHAGTGTTMNMQVTNINDSANPVVLGSVNDFPEGDTGLGINKAGVTSFDANDAAGFANNGSGRGWQWRYVKFELESETTVQVGVYAAATTYNQWMSFCDATVQMTEETYLEANKDGVEAAEAAARALVDTKPMGEDENAALQDALDRTYTTGAGMLAKVEALNAAVAKANAWRETYYAEKDKLVAALERFEADYNDGENGALDYMAKSRWETVIEKAQAAAVAKDNLTSHEVLTTATAELVAALDAATVSVNEYAALDEAIKAATALADGINWGDQPFQRPESAKDEIDTTDELALYTAAEADGESVTSVTEALNAAMDITLNVPSGDFYLTVATEGHPYLNKLVFASFDATGDNNPTGYVFNTTRVTADTHKFTFEQVEGNLYRISVEIGGEKVYLTTGSLNGSAAGWATTQIQGTTNMEKAATFKIEASPAVEGAFRIYNTVANAYVDCQDNGNIYTDTEIENEDFAIVDEYIVSTDIVITAENKVSTCVLMFDAEIPEGLTVYVAKEYAGDYMIFEVFKEGTLPAYTPCLLYAENGYEGTWEGDVVLDKYAATVTGEDDVYCGAIEDQTITAGYVLQNQGDGAKFYNVNGQTVPVPAGKCWLKVTTTTDTPSVTCLFRGGIANNIDEVMVDKTTPDGAIYTLDGKRVSRMERGKIYIINGQKIMVK